MHSEIGDFLRDSADESPNTDARGSDNGTMGSDNCNLSSDNLSASERKALSYIEGAGSVRSSEVADLLGMSQRGAQKLLNCLVDKGLVVSSGANRNRRYSVKE